MQQGTKSGTKLSIYSFCYHQMMWHQARSRVMSRHPLVSRDSSRGTRIDLTNGVTLKFNGMTILQHLCKDRDYFEFNIKLGTNMQNGYNLRD